MAATLVRHPDPVVLERDEFIRRRFDYRPGQHLTIMGPTESGKTTLLYQLANQVAHPKLPAIVLVMKPKDETVDSWAKVMRARRSYAWPPGPSMWFQRRPRAYTVWPRHTFDPDYDDAMMEAVFRRTLLDSYKRGKRIVVADEVYGLAVDLGLTRPLGAIWKRGRSMKCGLWAASQRPAFVPLDAYSMAQHLFLHRDPDLRARKRYSEIGGGIDPKMILDVTSSLHDHNFFYIGPGRRYCIVAP